MEIGPGKYSGVHWQKGFLFVWEDAFGMAEGILAKYVPNYDHFSMTDIPKEVGRNVVIEWRNVADRLGRLSAAEASAALNLAASYRDGLEDDVTVHKAEIANMLRELADACSEFYDRHDWVCILGM